MENLPSSCSSSVEVIPDSPDVPQPALKKPKVNITVQHLGLIRHYIFSQMGLVLTEGLFDISIICDLNLKATF